MNEPEKSSNLNSKQTKSKPEFAYWESFFEVESLDKNDQTIIFSTKTIWSKKMSQRHKIYTSQRATIKLIIYF